MDISRNVFRMRERMCSALMRRLRWWLLPVSEESKRSGRRPRLCRFAMQFLTPCFSNAVLHWVRDHDEMMHQVRRVLKPGGRFVAEMGGHGNVAAIHVALTAILERHRFGDHERGVNYYPTTRSYSERLKRHGFTVEQMALIPRPTKLPESGMEGWLSRGDISARGVGRACRRIRVRRW